MATVTSEQALGSLAANVHGGVLRPGDQAYDAARRIFNGMIDRRPRVIVQALGAGDVMQAVRFARENELPIAVRGGGHNVAGHALCDDGMLIDLSRLRSVRVDPQRRIADQHPVTVHALDHDKMVITVLHHQHNGGNLGFLQFGQGQFITIGKKAARLQEALHVQQ